ncbi:hypothetical protein LguiA_021820 [Lonicera macranthoides]
MGFEHLNFTLLCSNSNLNCCLSISLNDQLLMVSFKALIANFKKCTFGIDKIGFACFVLSAVGKQAVVEESNSMPSVVSEGNAEIICGEEQRFLKAAMEAMKIIAKGRRKIQAKELDLKVDEVEHIDFIGVDNIDHYALVEANPPPRQSKSLQWYLCWGLMRRQLCFGQGKPSTSGVNESTVKKETTPLASRSISTSSHHPNNSDNNWDGRPYPQFRNLSSQPSFISSQHYTRSRHNNIFSPLRDQHLLEENGDGEAWGNYLEDNPLKNGEHISNFIGFYSLVGSDKFQVVHRHSSLNVNKSLDWGNMADDEPFQSWEANADAEFNASLNITATNNTCIILGQHRSSSILN